MGNIFIKANTPRRAGGGGKGEGQLSRRVPDARFSGVCGPGKWHLSCMRQVEEAAAVATTYKN